MRQLLARILIVLGAALLGLGRKLEKPAPPPAAKMTIELPRRHYRPTRRQKFSLAWLMPSLIVGVG